MKNYYKILEVHKDASQDVISKVYKFLAKKYHPDANTDNKEFAEAKFKEISEAYEVLSDVTKKIDYDMALEEEEKIFSESPKLQELQNYCSQLEQEIEFLKAERNNQNFTAEPYYNEAQNRDFEFERRQQQAQTEAVEDAYNTAYVNTLKNMGYKIKYKQTFKQKCKNLLTLILTAIVVFIFLKILWNIPATKEFLKPIYDILSFFGLF